MVGWQEPNPLAWILRPPADVSPVARADHPRVVLMGARRVGKTVILEHLVRRLLDGGVPGVAILDASLDTALYSGGSLERLVRLFIEQQQDPAAGQYWILSDEVQYLKVWEVNLKSLVDTHPHIGFIPSGSAAVAMRMKIRGRGAGRFTEFVLTPSALSSTCALPAGTKA